MVYTWLKTQRCIIHQEIKKFRMSGLNNLSVIDGELDRHCLICFITLCRFAGPQL